mgnify:CR=1 FL=1
MSMFQKTSEFKAEYGNIIYDTVEDMGNEIKYKKN